MTSSSSGLRDAFTCALDMTREFKGDRMGLVGYGVIERFDQYGESNLLVPFANIITDTGDLFYGNRANLVATTALTGMQAGSGGATAVAKSGVGSAIVTLLAGQAFDATFPSVTNLGAGLGVQVVFKTTYAAGTATGTVSEATLTNGVIGTASTAANTIARIAFTGIVKGALDSLVITWNHKFLG